MRQQSFENYCVGCIHYRVANVYCQTPVWIAHIIAPQKQNEIQLHNKQVVCVKHNRNG